MKIIKNIESNFVFLYWEILQRLKRKYFKRCLGTKDIKTEFSQHGK